MLASSRRSRFWTALDPINLMIFVAYGITVLCFGGAFLSVLSLSLKTPADLFRYPPHLIPNPIAWNNYVRVFRESHLMLFLYNSLKIVMWATVGAILVSVPAAYGFSRFRFRGKKFVLLAILAFQMISPMIIVIPLYRYFKALGLLNTHFATIITFVAVQIPFTTWLLKGFFDSIPREIDEYALVDGCSRLGALGRVILPISAPGIASALIFNFIQSWSNFIVPFVLLKDTRLYPISVGILQFHSLQEEITTHLLAAGSMISILPVLLIFILAQRFIVGILIEGGVKG